MAEDKCLYKELSYEIVGLLFKVHKDLGRFRNEKQCGDYFEKLLQQKGLKYIREYRFNDHQYGNGDVRCTVDFIIEDKIIIELKMINLLLPIILINLIMFIKIILRKKYYNK